MLEFRLRALETFRSKAMPTWGADLSGLNFDEIHFFVPPETQKVEDWNSLPCLIQQDFGKLGVPNAERQLNMAVQAQLDSEMIYGCVKRELNQKGVIFTDTDTALREHPDLLRRYFGTIVPPSDNKFAALNSATWSGGAFVYVPAGVQVEMPLHSYFRVNAKEFGQFEHTLIVLEEGSRLSYVEACSALHRSTESLHAGVVEIVVGPRARCRFTSIQNWAKDMYNLATKRAVVKRGALMEWIGGNLGSRLTMAYPSVYLAEPDSRAEILSLSLAGAGQHHDTGTKVIHAAPGTTSQVNSKSISRGGGRSTFRSLIQVHRGASGSRSHVVCDSLILDPLSRCDTYPELDVAEKDVEIGHEASVSKIQWEQLFYLMCRGISESEANEMVISGFVEPLARELPLCYAKQLNELIRMPMDSAVG
ncbi:FeS cluster assembly protein SufB [Planctomycetes bacterium CA13]|uniref:FeS cluster assembly protein SufB n=2 Tax=Novipirellula herctigrandis TaxID=2527986 RepID=A0A5C5YXK8_9BACT|nr:FeS cluster assembly protein SufB [Planctomycetes bacterium CA13]